MELIMPSPGQESPAGGTRQLLLTVTDRVTGDEMTVNGTSGGTLHLEPGLEPGLLAHHDLGGRLAAAPPPARLLHRAGGGARAGQLRDEEAGGGPRGDDDGRLLQQGNWRS